MTTDARDITTFAERIQSYHLRKVIEFWNDCRGRQRFPIWPQLEPHLPLPLTDRVWAFDFNSARGEFTARFAGGNAMVGFGKSFRGTKLQDLHPPAVFALASANFRRVIDEPACCRWSGTLFKVGNELISGERIILPVGHGDDIADGVFGASDFDYPVVRTPDGLELVHDIPDWHSL